MSIQTAESAEPTEEQPKRGYDPARFAPGTPWATHDWDDKVPLWEDSAWWCRVCGIASFHDGAHDKCSGERPAAGRFGPPSVAVLIIEPVREREPA